MIQGGGKGGLCVVLSLQIFLLLHIVGVEARSPHAGSLSIIGSMGLFLIWPDQREAVASCRGLRMWSQLMP